MTDQTLQFKKLIFNLVKVSKSDFEHRLKECGSHITVLQYGVLSSLYTHSITLNELSKELSMKPPSLISVIDSLEKGGYLKRKQDKDDRRKIHLLISDKGKKTIDDLPDKIGSGKIQSALKSMGKEKIITIVTLLKELTELIEK